MSLAKLSVKNPVLVNMIMVIIFVFGTYTIYTIPKESMPAVNIGKFYTLITYPGVSPEEMETLVTNKIETALKNVDGVDYLSSSSYEGVSTVIINLKPNADIDEAWTDVNTAMDKIKDLPKDASDPTIVNISPSEMRPTCALTINGNYSENGLREIAEDMQDDLAQIAYVSKVEISGARDREIHIKADRNKLNEYGLSFADLSNAISRRNISFPAGKVDFGSEEFTVRTNGEFENFDEIGKLIIKIDKNGRIIKLNDIATVLDTLEVEDIYSRVDGVRNITLYVYQKLEGNILEVVKNIRKYMSKAKSQHPGLNINLINDTSAEVESNIGTLSNSAVYGMILVFVALLVFLGWRNAIFAAMGIPFTFILSFILMDYYGITINNLSLFALVLVLGMVVDDAIVVIENVHRYIEMGYSPKEAAIKGADEIKYPVIAAVLTTISAFLPLLMMEGVMGKFLSVFPIVVTMALLASLFEALLILPSHLADFSKPMKKDSNGKIKEHKLLKYIQKKYQSLVIVTLKHRFLSVLTVVIALILSGVILAKGYIGFEFFPSSTPKTINIKVETSTGKQLEETNKLAIDIEKFILNIKQKKDIEAVNTTVGKIQKHRRWEKGSSYIEFRIDLVDADDMTFDYEDIKTTFRDYLSKKPEIVTFRFDETISGPPTGNDIEIKIKGDDFDRLKLLGEQVKDVLKTIEGVADIDDSFSDGKKEIEIVPKYNKMKMNGLSVIEISNQVRTALNGALVSKLKGKGGKEYDIVLSLKDSQIGNLARLKELKIPTRYGTLIDLEEVADLKLKSNLFVIEHYDTKRVITITANNAKYEKNGKKIKQTTNKVMGILFGKKGSNDGLLSDLEANNPGYKIKIGGRADEQKKSFGSLYVAFIISLLIIYTILGTQFGSYVQPLIVMLTVPFAFIGVIFGLFVTGLSFSLLSLISILALAGIVVNDSLVLVDFVNRERAKGVDRWNSLINAGSTRLRPILLTTITTIFGFLPMILSQSESVATWKPMAVSISFGLAFATILTLLVIPVFYSIIDSVFGRLGLTRFKSHISFKEAMKIRKEKMEA